jgi:RNA methyltransferase, TrmH family
MPVRIVESKQNARLKELRRALASPNHRALRFRGIEGPHLVEEAIRANLKIACILAGDGMEHWLRRLRLPSATEVLIVPEGILASALSTETPQPVAALVEPPAWTWAHVLGAKRSAALVVALAGIQDPGNLGTIVRSAEAFGATGVVSLPGTVHAWNPKAVRASAGSVFRMPLLAAGAEECFARLRAAGVTILATAAAGAAQHAQPSDRARLKSPVALVIGNEGAGIPPELASQADGAITIPCPGPVESLNAAVAAGVLLYEAARQRAGETGNRKRGRR